MPLAKGGVQPLAGVDVPEDAVPGEYTGVVRVAELRAYPLGGATAQREGWVESGCDDRRVTDVAAQHGDSDLWRHARLRWLDSDVGSGAVTAAAAESGHGAHRWPADRLAAHPSRRGAAEPYGLGRRAGAPQRRGLPAALHGGRDRAGLRGDAGPPPRRALAETTNGGAGARSLPWFAPPNLRFDLERQGEMVDAAIGGSVEDGAR